MWTEEFQIGESLVRLAFITFVLWLFAQQFDATEMLAIGLFAVMEGIMFYWRNRR